MVHQRRPRIGILPMLQEFYKGMMPGIETTQESYANAVFAGCADSVDLVTLAPVSTRDEAAEAFNTFRSAGVDGIVVLMTTYAPAMFIIRDLLTSGLPILIANTQPESSVGDHWKLTEMCHNQGVHGAQDVANALVRASRRFDTLTADWRSDEFAAAVVRWARASAVAQQLAQLRIAVFGYPLDGMGDLRLDEQSFRRVFGPDVTYVSTGDLVRARDAVASQRISDAMAIEDDRFEIDPSLTPELRAEHLALELGLRDYLEAHGYGAFSAHFGALTDDGRLTMLPLAAACTLLSEGYGYAAEGDVPAAAMVAAAHLLIGDAHFTEMFAMDFERGTVLMSHLGEGNPVLARDDEPVALVRRNLGFGPSGDTASFVFRLAPGPATIASLVSLGDVFRIVVAEGDILDTAPMADLQMPNGHFAPSSGLAQCLDAWMQAGGTHHQALTRGHCADDWDALGRVLGVEVIHV